jgi:beta-N-acetylhexosaminidase
MHHTSLRQKIGQLFLIGFTGDTLAINHPIVTDIKKEKLGGVILFDKFLAEKKDANNINSAEQLQQLTADLQKFAGGDLIIAVDQEGGKVNRFKKERGFPTTPAAAELGGARDTQATAACARQTARMLRAAGVNLNLAPVVDVNVNDDNPIIGRYGRSFSDNSRTVAEHATAWIREHQAEGIQCCLKHFPGHGSSDSDSHLGFVDISASWGDDELAPYRLLIGSGHAAAIMVGHLINRNFDPIYPATLSSATLRTLLRRDLHFNGLVISDDMQMKAITDCFGLEEACCKALAAGIDLLLIGNNLVHDPGILLKVKNSVFAAVQKGAISEKRIEEAYGFVQKFKRSLRCQHAPK